MPSHRDWPPPACGRMDVRVSRRRFVQVGGLGLMGVTLPRLLAAQSQAAADGIRPRADSCVLIFLNGGPSHLDMWDMKPDAADGIRGEFKPIATSLAGYRICEHLPRLATQMHRATVVRSMHHSVNNAHAAAVYTSLTGHDRGDANVAVGASLHDVPTPGAVISMLRPPAPTIVPQGCLPDMTKEGAGGPPQPGFFGGFLGRAHDPLFVLKDPNAADFSVPELTLQAGVSAERLSERRALFDELDGRLQSGRGATSSAGADPDGPPRRNANHRAGNSRPADAMTSFQQRALDLLTSRDTQDAFRISQESDKVRDAYGRNIYGQSVLLARRLIEAGTRAVTVSWAPDANATWDTHSGNFEKLKSILLPQFDAACASLITDLAERGLLERTVIAVLGDFGRTPKVNGNNAGRDHWNHCYSLMLVGGGFQQGLVYGSSDAIGAFPAANPLVPGDMISTIYHCLGIRHDREIHDQLERPHRLVPVGEVVRELVT